MKRAWAILRPHHVTRPRVDGGGTLTTLWLPIPPRFKTRAEAVRAYMEKIDPDLKGASDYFIQQHWAVEVRNSRAKVKKV